MELTLNIAEFKKKYDLPWSDTAIRKVLTKKFHEIVKINKQWKIKSHREWIYVDYLKSYYLEGLTLDEFIDLEDMKPFSIKKSFLMNRLAKKGFKRRSTTWRLREEEVAYLKSEVLKTFGSGKVRTVYDTEILKAIASGLSPEQVAVTLDYKLGTVYAVIRRHRFRSRVVQLVKEKKSALEIASLLKTTHKQIYDVLRKVYGVDEVRVLIKGLQEDPFAKNIFELNKKEAFLAYVLKNKEKLLSYFSNDFQKTIVKRLLKIAEIA